MIDNDERETVLMFHSYRNTARVARNAISEEAVRIEREGNPFEAIAHLVKGARGREGLISGDLDHGVWSAGMVQGLIQNIPRCDEPIQRIVDEATAIVEDRLAGMMARQRA